MLKPTTRSWLHSYPSMISIGSKSLLQPNAGQLAVARSTRRVASRVAARVAAATRVAGLGSLWNAHGAGMFAYGCMTGWFWKVGESSWIFRMWSCAVQPSSLLTMLSCADEVPTLSHDMFDSFGLTEKTEPCEQKHYGIKFNLTFIFITSRTWESKCHRVPQVIPIPPSQPQHRSQGARTATARGPRHLRTHGGDFRGGFRGKGHCPGRWRIWSSLIWIFVEN